MKELSIEEKAKRYDEAIEKAQKWYDANTNEGYRGIFEDIFSELKESEDERIRKEIMKFIFNYPQKLINRDSWLDWLEKQCEQKSLDDIAKEVTKDKDAAISFLKSTGIINENGELADEYKIEQGEQKTADKVEPKFHEGEWIIHQGTENIYQVVAIIDNQYQLKYGDNYTTQYCEDVDRCTRLWNVAKDAEDGDVLYINNTVSESIIIYESFNNGLIKKYASYNKFGFEGEHYLTLNDGYIVPATKEQRNLLFQKMKEAGYEWDAEKKELKKNEPIPTAEGMKIISRTKCEFAEWSEEDESTINEVIMNYESAYLPPVDKRYNIINRLKSLKDRVQSQQRQDWKQENIEELSDFESAMMHIGGSFFGQHAGLDPNDTNAIKEQANLLLELIPKKEWSDEDERIRIETIELLETANHPNKMHSNGKPLDFTENINWLKSLKDRYTWKPSDKQLDALHDAAVYIDKSMFLHPKGILMKLYKQLKKLRKE